jgi:putative transposase
MTQPTPPDRIAVVLARADELLRDGRSSTEVAAELGVSLTTYHRWRRQYSGMRSADIERIKELERENARLRRILVDRELENEALREISRREW